MGYTGFLRVCTYCCKVVLSYAQRREDSDDLRSFGEDLHRQMKVAADESEHSPGGSTQQDMGKWTPTSRRKGHRVRMSTIFDEDSQTSARSSPDPALTSQPAAHPFDVTPINELETLQTAKQERQCLIKDLKQLREICECLLSVDDGLELQSHRHRLRTYTGCLVGNEIVDWLIQKEKAMSREHAVAIGQALLDRGWLECVSANHQLFTDLYALYRPDPVALGDDTPAEVMDDSVPVADDTEDDSAPLWFKAIERNQAIDEQETDCLSELNKIPSTVSVPENLDASSKSVFYVETPAETSENNQPIKRFRPLSATSLNEKALRDSTNESRPTDYTIPAVKGTSPSEEAQELETSGGWQESEMLREDNGDRIAYERLKSGHKEHMACLVRQLLRHDGLSLKWADTILSISRRIAIQVRPDVRHEGDDMDIRQYVSIKKIPGGLRSQTSIICGVVCTKIVAHKRMRHNIATPKVLLLRGPIEYQRVENKFSSLEPQILQEHEFLKNCVGRIAALDPDILLVEKTVSRLAQEFILAAGITLVLNVKPSVMERVSRFTQAGIITSIDGLVSKTTLGFCHSFKTQTYILPEGIQKSLLYFDGCASHLGCTITLRGGTTRELIKVKRILHFITFVAYHSKLEVAFLMDEFALPPPGPGENVLELLTPDGLKQPPGQSPGGTSNQSLGGASSQSPEGTSNQSPGGARNQLQDGATSQSPDGALIADHESILPSDITVSETSANTSRDSHLVAPVEDTNMRSGSPSRMRASPRTVDVPVTKILDQSDPLQNYQISQDESIFKTGSDALTEVTQTGDYFKQALNDTILSASPHIRYDIPYLETETGSKCLLRSFFSKEIYWSDQFLAESHHLKRPHSDDLRVDEHKQVKGRRKAHDKNYHPFVVCKITAPITDPKTQSLLADFRARGGSFHALGQPGKPNGCVLPLHDRESSPFIWNPKVDCLDPVRHQRIAVLFSSYSLNSPNHPNPCVSPWVVTMDYYGRNDITLGGFLERYCFRESYVCPSRSCDAPMVEHVRRFVHEFGSIQVILKQLERPMPAYENNILMWEWCRRCKQVTPVVPMSLETWSMSFAKYLEIRFHGTAYGKRSYSSNCAHSLHQEHFQYFGYRDIVASFKYFPVTMKEIALPAMTINIRQHEMSVQQWNSQQQMLSYKGNQVFTSILDHLLKCQTQSQTESQAGVVTAYINQVQDEKMRFTKSLEELKQSLAHVEEISGQSSGGQGHSESRGQGHEDSSVADLDVAVCRTLDSISRTKRLVAEAVTKWNAKIVDFTQQQKKLDKERNKNPSSASLRRDYSSVDEVTESLATRWLPKEEDLETEPTFVVKETGALSSDTEPTFVAKETDGDDHVIAMDTGTNDLIESTDGNQDNSGSFTGDKTAPCKSGSADNLESSPKVIQSDVTDSRGHQRSISLGESKKMSKQLTLVRDASSSDLEKKSVKSYLSNLLSGAWVDDPVQMPFSAEEHHVLSQVLPSTDYIPVIIYDQEPSSIIAYALSCPDYEKKLQELWAQQSGDDTNSPYTRRKYAESGISDPTDQSEPAPLTRRSSVLSFFRGAARDKSPIHQVAAPAVTSKKFNIEAVKYTPRTDRDSVEEMDEPDYSFFAQSADVEKPPLGGSTVASARSRKDESENCHIELQFSDLTANFYCKVYFADQFKKLRKLIFPAGEDRYIRSLSRCFTWLVKGGKSGSSFCKTQDDRFILKQMSRYEVQSFNKFAPHYFTYITKAHSEQKPTVLAKILGVYRIGFKNSQTFSENKQDLLVMENLFYDRDITQIFDLKGSLRNRLVTTMGKRVEDLVLLDENLLKLSIESPLYIRPHSKTILSLAVTNDTQFLSGHLVMDYSLLVGVDETRQELVLGIIDYIRTFTWDKKLEMVVKTTLGGQGKRPTVIYPESYRSRFIQSMDRYFLPVPDRWAGLGRDVDC